MTDKRYRELYDAHKARLMAKGFTEAEAHQNAGHLAERGVDCIAELGTDEIER